MKTIYLCHDLQESPAARQNFLEMAGYEVQLFNGARELFRAIQDNEPDLVMMDVLLEGKNGFEICAEMHLTRARSFPVIVCSHVYRGRVFRDEALNSGAAEYFLLPMNLDEFVSQVNDVINAHGRDDSGGLELDVA